MLRIRNGLLSLRKNRGREREYKRKAEERKKRDVIKKRCCLQKGTNQTVRDARRVELVHRTR